MTPKERLLEAALQEARDIKSRGNLNDEEKADLVARVEKIEEMRKSIADEKRVREALGDDLTTEDQGEKRYTKSLGHEFAASRQFADAAKAGFRGTSESFEYKAEPTVVDTVGAGSPAFPGLVVAQRVNQIEGLTQYPLGVEDLIPTIQTSANAVTYYIETSETHTIAGALEGSEKGNFTLAGVQVTDEVEVIAGMAAITRQTLSDAPFMAGFVDQRMRYRLRQVVENELIDGTGTSPALLGLLARTTSAHSQSNDSLADAAYKAMDECFTDGGYPADAFVFNPTDWQPLALSKDQNDRYIGAGPFAQAVGPTLWGRPVVLSTQITAGTVLVGAFKQGAFIARNGGTVVRTSDSHSDYFKKNKIAVLIEERLALGVPAPLAFCELTLS